jgi:protein-tyrosine-phosphatase
VRILFACRGNTCRSLFAEYLTNARLPIVRAESGGIRPQPASDAKNAVDTLRTQFDIDASRHVPRDLASVDVSLYDRVIALDAEALACVRKMSGVNVDRIAFWKINDPWGGDSSEYDRCALANFDASSGRTPLTARSRDR